MRDLWTGVPTVLGEVGDAVDLDSSGVGFPGFAVADVICSRVREGGGID